MLDLSSTGQHKMDSYVLSKGVIQALKRKKKKKKVSAWISVSNLWKGTESIKGWPEGCELSLEEL